jgi:hypothetical protein
MALILDGNGLIQGLDAGGLPSGSVNADSLASTLDLSSKTMTFGNVSASGITFPATQSASGNANTLDDYEEGTWTPVIAGLTSAGTGTYDTQNGTYTKIGRQVTVGFFIGWTAHTGTGDMSITGLPFTCATGLQNQISGSLVTSQLTYQTGTAAQACTERGEAYLTVFTMGSAIDWDHVNMDSSAYLRGCVTYFV